MQRTAGIPGSACQKGATFTSRKTFSKIKHTSAHPKKRECAANFEDDGKPPGHPPLLQSHNLSGFFFFSLALSLSLCVQQSIANNNEI